MTIPVPGDSLASMKSAIIGCLMAVALPGFACDYPDEGGMPLRRAVTRVEMLPEVDAWARAAQKNGVKPQYLVRLDEPVHHRGRCYWPVEVRGNGRLWRRFLVSPDGKSLLADG
jgi:hypothetical protein